MSLYVVRRVGWVTRNVRSTNFSFRLFRYPSSVCPFALLCMLPKKAQIDSCPGHVLVLFGMSCAIAVPGSHPCPISSFWVSETRLACALRTLTIAQRLLLWDENLEFLGVS